MTPQERAKIKTEDAAWYVRKVRLNAGGYDAGGGYWGSGGSLYQCYNARELLYFRAATRDGAVSQLRAHYAPCEIVVHRG